MPQALRDAAFQIVSISTTTGFATVDFATWPPFSQTLLLLLMFIGGCLGSTSGALRLERLILLGKLSVQRLRRMVRPRQVELLLIDETPVERETVHYITTYFGLYLGIAACILRSAPAIEGYAPTCKANRIRHSGIGAGFLTVSQTQDRRPS